ncbi:MAG: hypothetical protein B6U88_00895 [Candidatus Aenigmarchaeota archaeon ex4484_56]|nr:MAG: hypothetical protein B6U88_00895 [Candidatus Aenigmarchaeota archaeon ex4484_56]
MTFPKKKNLTNKAGWKDLPEGAVISNICSKENKTGNWASMKPVWDSKKCTHCLLCVVYCPEGCIPVKNNKREDTNPKYCKGCGICARECPMKAIEMKLK